MMLLPVLGILCAVSGVVAAVLIARELERRGLPVNYVWLGLFIPKYIGQYARITHEETGRVGPLFYLFVLPLSVALFVFAVLAIRGWS
ncbi:MAG: hypothetical protein JW892_00910 [Anaerolineae bacterium]|nr:hypothetical protein [Anaerolineae bacterium]